MKTRRCPKCRALPGTYIEVWNGHTIEFDADQGMPAEEGYLNPGYPDHVVAVCDKCNHRWRLRGISQITELDKQQDSI